MWVECLWGLRANSRCLRMGDLGCRGSQQTHHAEPFFSVISFPRAFGCEELDSVPSQPGTGSCFQLSVALILSLWLCPHGGVPIHNPGWRHCRTCLQLTLDLLLLPEHSATQESFFATFCFCSQPPYFEIVCWCVHSAAVSLSI